MVVAAKALMEARMISTRNGRMVVTPKDWHLMYIQIRKREQAEKVCMWRIDQDQCVVAGGLVRGSVRADCTSLSFATIRISSGQINRPWPLVVLTARLGIERIEASAFTYQRRAAQQNPAAARNQSQTLRFDHEWVSGLVCSSNSARLGKPRGGIYTSSPLTFI